MILADAFRSGPRAAAPDAMSDFWYSPDPAAYMLERSIGGLGLSPETIMKCSTVYGAVAFRGDSWAMCPPSTFLKTATGRKEQPDHYSQLVLRNPNQTQTGNRWRNLNGVWMATWGNAYNEIVAGPRSWAQELRPMHPSRVAVKDQRADGTLVYSYRDPATRTERLIGQESVLHFRDLSLDGIVGLPMYQLVRTVVGIALLAERHASTFLAKGARISGLLVPKKPLDPDQRKVLRESVNKDLGGSNNTGTFGILPADVELKPITTTHRESQFIELSDLIVGSILRFLRVPGVLVGYSKDLMGYASAKEFYESGGIKHCVLPILTNVEAEEEKALLVYGSGLQIKHNLDVLLRANIKDRYEAYAKALGSAPWQTINEVRAQEDFDEDPDPRSSEIRIPTALLPPAPEPLQDGGEDGGEDGAPAPGGPPKPPSGDPAAPDAEAVRIATAARTIQQIYLGVGVVLSDEEARSMVSAAGFPLPGALPPGAKKAPPTGAFGGPPAPRPEAPTAPADDDEGDEAAALRARAALAERLADSMALRTRLREKAAVRGRAETLAVRDPKAWATWVGSYFDKHVEYLTSALALTDEAARAYCDEQARVLVAGGAAAVAEWELGWPQLAALVLGGETRC